MVFERRAMCLARPATLDYGGGMIDVARPTDVCSRANIDRRRVEMSCRLAMLLIIVKTLVCTRAIKGFYYDERLCRRAKVLVDPVENLERRLESLERLCENLGGVEMGQAGGFGLLARPPFVPARLVALGDELQRLVEAGHVNGGGAGGRGSGRSAGGSHRHAVGLGDHFFLLRGRGEHFGAGDRALAAGLAVFVDEGLDLHAVRRRLAGAGDDGGVLGVGDGFHLELDHLQPRNGS